MSTVHKVMQLWRPGQYIKPYDAGPRLGHLFGAGEQGGVYLFDKAHQGGLFQDAAFTTPVTAVEQYVGSFLDWSGNANHCAQPTSTARGKWSARANLFLDSPSLATQSVTVSAGSYRLILGGTGSVTLSGAATGTYGAGTHTITCTAGSLTCTVSGTVNDADIRRSASAYLPYQAVNTATDYDTAGFPHYLFLDGADDNYLTSNLVDFTGTSRMTLAAAYDADISGANIGMLVNHGGTGFNSFRLMAPRTPGAVGVSYIGNSGAAEIFVSPGGSRDMAVLSAQFDLAAASGNIRRDAVNGPYSAAVTGGGVFQKLVLAVGKQSNSDSRYMKGNLYGMIVRGAASSAAELSFAERYLANLQGRTL